MTSSASFKKSPKAQKPKEDSVGFYYSLIYPLAGLTVLLLFLMLGLEIVRYQPEVPVITEKTLGFKDLLPTPAPYPVNQHRSQLAPLSAHSVVVMDSGSMAIMYQKEVDLRLSPASTTKIMTALVILDYFRPDEAIKVGKLEVEGNLIGLVEGEELTVESLLYGLLVGSANDAAAVLATAYPGGQGAFVAAMNQKAAELKMTNTHFTNPAGLDEEGHHSTARDLAKLTRLAIKNPLISKIVSTQSQTITDLSGAMAHQLTNTNELVGAFEGVKGVKTGWTESAGECLISLVERNGERVITVILGSKNRFEETKTLIEWVFDNFTWQAVLPATSH